MEGRMKEAELRKQEIMQTALKLFVSRGYEKTSTNDIIKALNLSRGGLYHHFKSKEEILDTAIHTLFLSEIKKVEETINSGTITSIEKLKILIEFNAPSQPMMEDVKTVLSTKDNPTLISHLLKEKLRIVTPLFVQIIEQGIKEGIFKCRYPEEVSKVAVILSTILFTDTIVTMTYEEYERTILVFQTAMEALVGAAPGTFDFMRQSIKNSKW